GHALLCRKGTSEPHAKSREFMITLPVPSSRFSSRPDAFTDYLLRCSLVKSTYLMPHSKNPRLYFALVILLVCASVLLLDEHRPSFLRPNLHMYAYVSTSDGSLTVIDLAGLRVVAHIPVASNISDLREHTSRDEIWGVSSTDGVVWVLDAPSSQLTRIPV